MKVLDKYRKFEEIMNDENVSAAEIDEKIITGYKGFYNKVGKRVIDFTLALMLLIFLLPIFIIVSFAILIEDGMPILYRAQRGGFHGEKFYICKFRTMIKNADKIGSGTTALNDSRITRVGNILRKTKIDEFANLLNILTGEMSFIGPRPELLQYVNGYKGSEKLILEVRPGITDYSSIEFINLDEIVGSSNVDEMYEKYVLPRKNKLRVKYAATVSFKTDIELFGLTVLKVFHKAFVFLLKKDKDKKRGT